MAQTLARQVKCGDVSRSTVGGTLLNQSSTAETAQSPFQPGTDGTLVSFIVPAWNEQAVLAGCLAALERLQLPDGVEGLEVIVVDNESTDGTAAVAAESGARVLTVQPGRASRARNAGAMAAQGQLLAFVDADCELDADWLAVCAGHLRRPDVVAAGTALAAPRPEATWVEQAWFAIVGESGPEPVREVAWLASFNLLVKKDAFLAAGAFDESLETCEDCDLGYRLHALGVLVCDQRAATTHHGESKSLRQLIQREAWRSRGNLRLLRRYGLNLREGIAVAVPLLFLTGLVAGPLGIAISLMRQSWVLPWTLLMLMSLLIPAGILLVKGVIPCGLTRSIQCLVVYSSYLCGRAIGFLMPVRRVQRIAGPVATDTARQADLPKV